ncbi:MAG: discoidin domain-containing protein [Bacteroidota bacterium]
MFSIKKRIQLIAVFTLWTVAAVAQPENRINHQGQDLFLNGGNIAWLDFARDVGPGTTRLSELRTMFEQVNARGGNTMRFWVHITGANTPSWSGNTVTGPGTGTIDDMRNILDAAWENNVGLVLCLWSFDMLRTSNGTGITNRAKALLEDSTLTQRYIDNALIPMVEALGDHPGVIAWEIFNEPEGMTEEFGWDFTRHVPMSAIQRFVNQTAGAIHRTNANAKVTNGSWSFHALAETSSPVSKNYYSDTELISAGKDSLGILDFYQVHYYSWAGTELSPFHHNADHWGLQKPIVVGEFGIPDELFGIDGDTLYEELYTRGYAGAWVWQWVDWYSNRGTYAESWLRGLDQMYALSIKYAEDVTIGERLPRVLEFETFPDEIAVGDSARLTWLATFSETTTLNGEMVSAIDTVWVKPELTTEYTLIATNGDNADTASVTVTLVEPNQINRALQKKVYILENETCCGNDVPDRVVDGDLATRWASAWKNNQWIYIDLGEVVDISQVILEWEVAYGNSYNIDVSLDTNLWTTVFEERDGDGDTDEIVFQTPVKGRYVRMFGLTRATTFGFSLWEFEVKGVPSVTQPPAAALVVPSADIELRTGSDLQVELNVEEGSGSIQQAVFFSDDQAFDTVYTAPFATSFEDVETGERSISARLTDSNGFIVQTDAYTITVTENLDEKRMEAEQAVLSGEVSRRVQQAGVSGGMFTRMDEVGVIDWKNVGLGRGNIFDLRFRYRVTSGSKRQWLSVNGIPTDTLQFLEHSGAWGIFDTTITVTEPLIELGIQSLDGFMDIDYLEVSINEFSVNNEEDAGIPARLSLAQNYPNPFNPSTSIQYSLADASQVSIMVFNLLGQHVATLVNGRRTAGNHEVRWDASAVSSGVYMYQIRSGSEVITRKMLLIK